MDLVECEAPLDSSFQKDRLELVNKGSLGRRRKPSRSNLRLILSPSNDQQDLDAFHNHFDPEASFVQTDKVSPCTSFRKSALDNQKESPITDHSKKPVSSQRKDISTKNPQSVVFNNYREVVNSLNQISAIKCLDFNGNSHQQINHQKLGNLQKIINGGHEGIVQNGSSKINSESNNVNSKRYSYSSVIKNQQNLDAKNCQVFNKLNNNNAEVKSNIHNTLISKNQKEFNSKSSEKTINNHNQHHNQRTVASNNQQNIITFSNHRQIVTSTPIQSKKTVVPNGKTNERITLHESSSKLCIESSLPRTSKEPNLVAEAQQFSIEAKLKRKKSDVQGRSAVLIQTWERRTQSESYSKLRKDAKIALKNRFSGKEISDANSIAMPDSYICIKYKGSLQNGDNLLKGEMVPNVRDLRPDETMLYRVPENRHHTASLEGTTNGRLVVNGKSSVQEPEWISLSRKLCAKFVEGHIETNSPDSYPYEEPEGVGEEPIPSLQSIKTHSTTNTTIPEEVKKRKISPTTPCEETPSSDQPPWIHLSRKLCTKFIEEHIEYPPITNGHFIKVPELIEPNGDVRIIEKIGKPKRNKSKQKKECEPEWISLSKKLRAKFIESHIDDPDTMVLDNQLNVSDHEETGSETFSDISQDTAVLKESNQSLKKVECKNLSIKSEIAEEKSSSHETNMNQINNEDAVFSEPECCWQYQAMEFDQESNSGNFQELEFFDQQPQEENRRIHEDCGLRDSYSKFEERIKFENSCSQQNPECFNNDVKFAPLLSQDDCISDGSQQKKIITVQFIAHVGKDTNYKLGGVNGIPVNAKDINEDSVFNSSEWEEVQYTGDDEGEQVPEKSFLSNDFCSKSLDSLCDSSQKATLLQNNERKKDIQNSPNFEEAFFLGDKSVSEQEEPINGKGNEIGIHEFKGNSEYSNNVLSSKENSICACDDMNCEPENKTLDYHRSHQQKRQNTYEAIVSSSEDEVFECDSRNRPQCSCSDSSEAANCKTPTRHDEALEEQHSDGMQIKDGKKKRELTSENGKNIKCNGLIPNSIYDGYPDNRRPTDKNNQNENNEKSSKEPKKLGMSKWITISKSEQNLNKPEYSNIQSTIQKEQNSRRMSSVTEEESKHKLRKNKKESKKVNENSKNASNVSEKNTSSNYESEYATHYNRMDEASQKFNGPTFKESDLKAKCKSLCDISFINSSSENQSSFRQHESVTDLTSAAQAPDYPKIEFQHFDCSSEIPLCAKLVSNHHKKNISKSILVLTGKGTESPCPSENSHVYEDMFKETPSGPSDSEASSWTAVRNNTYYVNGRSCSMNDLDFSDSCSLSVKCDYASSSDNSTLQSRRSSYASSSFYVNLRDYDSHMLEPSLSKGKKSNGRVTNNGTAMNTSKSNPPTPESLRHLFTSPFNSIHSPPNRTQRLLTRMPSDPQSHYYSTATATSSAFKHGFAATPPKPKKTERSSSLKIKDIAQGIILTFKKFQNNSKNLNVSSTQQVDVSHLAEMKSNSELGKTRKGQKDGKKQSQENSYWTENGKTLDTDSSFLSDVHRTKAQRSSSDLTDLKSNSDLSALDKKKGKSSKKSSNRDKGKKSKTKSSEPRTVPTVSRKVQQMADGTLYLVTTVSGDTTLPGVYSDSPDTSSELSSHRPVKLPEESNC